MITWWNYITIILKKVFKLHLIGYLILSPTMILKNDKFNILIYKKLLNMFKTWVIYVLINKNIFLSYISQQYKIYFF